MKKMTSYFSTLIYSFLITTLMTGCFMGPTPLTLDQQSTKIHESITKGGYSPVLNYDIESITETWQHDGQGIQITLLAPVVPGNYPLIVYLPGLGESSEAGKLWRVAWAKAGYSVFSVQPINIGDALKGTPKVTPTKTSSWFSKDSDNSVALKDVRNSDLRYIGHQYFSQEQLSKHINHVLWAYAQLKQRTQNKLGLFARADLARAIIAGYDIGAQTSAAMIGETYDIALPSTADFRPLAAILLSPTVDMALGDISTRYQNISIPILAVTGTEDDDPSAISTPFARTAIWEYAPPGNKYLLVLKKGNHPLLSGDNLIQNQDQKSTQEPSEETESTQNKSRFSNNYGSGSGRNSNHGSNTSNETAPKSRGGSKLNGNQTYTQVAVVYSVSIAFLDHICKNDNIAHTWLSDKANLWINKSATLKVK
jgi:hypothetical protein